MKIILLFTMLALAAAEVQFQHPEEWQLWKAQHGKSYQSQREELDRHLIWLANREYINGHNKNAHIFGFTLAMNHLGDMTDVEYSRTLLTYNYVNHTHGVKVFDSNQYSASLPTTVDWRTLNAVTPTKRQGQCGSSYAFSTTGAIEGVWALSHSVLEPLSEQNIIDCSVPYGNHGCKGGNMYDSYKYIISNEGIDTAKSYGYVAQQTYCKYSVNGLGAYISGFVQIKSGSENDLQSAVANVGPISVAVDASSTAFRYYSGGVYSSIRCSSTYINHAMLVTGYGTYNGKDYYLVKNSWGKEWGVSEGYIMMSRNSYNQCGVATDASFPTL